MLWCCPSSRRLHFDDNYQQSREEKYEVVVEKLAIKSIPLLSHDTLFSTPECTNSECQYSRCYHQNSQGNQTLLQKYHLEPLIEGNDVGEPNPWLSLTHQGRLQAVSNGSKSNFQQDTEVMDCAMVLATVFPRADIQHPSLATDQTHTNILHSYCCKHIHNFSENPTDFHFEPISYAPNSNVSPVRKFDIKSAISEPIANKILQSENKGSDQISEPSKTVSEKKFNRKLLIKTMRQSCENTKSNHLSSPNKPESVKEQNIKTISIGEDSNTITTVMRCSRNTVSEVPSKNKIPKSPRNSGSIEKYDLKCFSETQRSRDEYSNSPNYSCSVERSVTPSKNIPLQVSTLSKTHVNFSSSKSKILSASSTDMLDIYCKSIPENAKSQIRKPKSCVATLPASSMISEIHQRFKDKPLQQSQRETKTDQSLELDEIKVCSSSTGIMPKHCKKSNNYCKNKTLSFEIDKGHSSNISSKFSKNSRSLNKHILQHKQEYMPTFIRYSTEEDKQEMKVFTPEHLSSFISEFIGYIRSATQSNISENNFGKNITLNTHSEKCMSLQKTEILAKKAAPKQIKKYKHKCGNKLRSIKQDQHKQANFSRNFNCKDKLKNRWQYFSNTTSMTRSSFILQRNNIKNKCDETKLNVSFRKNKLSSQTQFEHPQEPLKNKLFMKTVPKLGIPKQNREHCDASYSPVVVDFALPVDEKMNSKENLNVQQEIKHSYMSQSKNNNESCTSENNGIFQTTGLFKNEMNTHSSAIFSPEMVYHIPLDEQPKFFCISSTNEKMTKESNISAQKSCNMDYYASKSAQRCGLSEDASHSQSKQVSSRKNLVLTEKQFFSKDSEILWKSEQSSVKHNYIPREQTLYLRDSEMHKKNVLEATHSDKFPATYQQLHDGSKENYKEKYKLTNVPPCNYNESNTAHTINRERPDALNSKVSLDINRLAERQGDSTTGDEVIHTDLSQHNTDAKKIQVNQQQFLSHGFEMQTKNLEHVKTLPTEKINKIIHKTSKQPIFSKTNADSNSTFCIPTSDMSSALTSNHNHSNNKSSSMSSTNLLTASQKQDHGCTTPEELKDVTMCWTIIIKHSSPEDPYN